MEAGSSFPNFESEDMIGRAVRRAFLLLFVAATVCCARVNRGTDSQVELKVPEPRQQFTVAILGDRTTGYESGLAVLEEAVWEVNRLRPALVLHIGDMVPGYTRDMEKWRADIRRVKDILSELQAPFFPVVGNHDVITGTADPGDRRGERLYKRHFGPLYYSFDYANAHFVCLNSEESLRSEPRLSERQMEWLERDLETADAKHVFVLLHKPMWEYEGAGWERVHRLLLRHPVRAVFAGHFHHYYRSQNRDGIQYYVLGVTGGRTFSPPAAGGLEHYGLLNVGRGWWNLALLRPGAVLGDDYVTNDDFKNMEKIRFLGRDEAGIANSVRSPESGPVEDTVTAFAANPLDTAVEVTFRGVSRGGSWVFRPPSRSIRLGPGRRGRVHLGIRSPRVAPADLSAPEVEIEYAYTDSKGRRVPLPLPRRVPVRRKTTVARVEGPVRIDAVADEPGWEAAPVLTTERWRSSPYETAEEGPAFRVLAGESGLYFFAESPDEQVSGFRDGRILSDALFLGLTAAPQARRAEKAAEPSVVVMFPFAEADRPRAVRASWDRRAPEGEPAEGVQMEAVVLAPGGWRCEGFVPWRALGPFDPSEGGELLFNVGAWDNDGELFHELHAWAPTDGVLGWGRASMEPFRPE